MRESYTELEKRVKREESGRVKDLELKLTSLQETLEAERQNHAQMEGRKQAMIQQEELIASLQETISDQVSLSLAAFASSWLITLTIIWDAPLTAFRYWMCPSLVLLSFELWWVTRAPVSLSYALIPSDHVASNIRSLTSRLEAGDEQHKKETELIESLQNQVRQGYNGDHWQSEVRLH